MPEKSKIQNVTIRFRLQVPENWHPFRNTKIALGEGLSKIIDHNKAQILPGADIGVQDVPKR